MASLQERVLAVFFSPRSAETPQKLRIKEVKQAFERLPDKIHGHWRSDLEKAQKILSEANQLLRIDQSDRLDTIDTDVVKFQITLLLVSKRITNTHKSPEKLARDQEAVEKLAQLSIKDLILRSVEKSQLPILEDQEFLDYTSHCLAAATKIVDLHTDDRGQTLPRPNQFNVRSQLPFLFRQIRLFREEIAQKLEVEKTITLPQEELA